MQLSKGRFSLAFDNSPLFRLTTAAFFIALLTLTLRQLNTGVRAAPDFESSSPGPELVVEILPGESGSDIGRKLEELNVIKSSEAFFRVAVSDARSKQIAAGEHRLETRIPAKTALAQLLDPYRIPNLIVVRDGQRLNEIIESVIKFGISKEELLRALEKITPSKEFKSKSLEGFLYPAQYSFNKGVDAKEILTAMVKRFNLATKEVKWSSKSEFSAYEIVVIASLVQTEGTPDVFGKVSRVIYNRLEKRMPLQFDSTVHYFLNRRGQIQVSIADTKVKNKYNTFVYPGLPPGPIGSPTKAAIDAALNPEEGNWLYFVTVKPLDTRFTNSYDEFLEWKIEFKKNFRAGLFE